MSKVKTKNKLKAKYRPAINTVVVHVHASFNNTIITVTDTKGNTLAWGTAGASGFRGSRKSTPHAAQVAARAACQKAKELHKSEHAEVWVSGPGPGRESSIRAVTEFFNILMIMDVTGSPFNGCREPKERRG